MSRAYEHHFACPGGCGELADECACRNPNPLGSMRVEPAIGSDPIAVEGLRRVRAAMPAHTPRANRDDDPNPTRARALARARTERTKEQP